MGAARGGSTHEKAELTMRFGICHRHAEGSANTLHDVIRGRRSGGERAVGTEAEREVRKLIGDRMPAQLKIDCSHWTAVLRISCPSIFLIPLQ